MSLHSILSTSPQSTRIENSSLFLLSGETNLLPQAELRALLETYGNNDTQLFFPHPRVGIATNFHDRAGATRRGAFIRYGGQLIAIYSSKRFAEKYSMNDVLGPRQSFAVRVVSLSGTVDTGQWERVLGENLKRSNPNSIVSLDSPEELILGILCGDILLVSKSVVDMSSRQWRSRRPSERPFFHPSALEPKFGCALVNLSRIRTDQWLLDPFCGTGSILMEANRLGIQSIGIDIAGKMVRGTLVNLRSFDLQSCGVVHADSTQPPVCGVDAVVTDLPYGRSSSTFGRSTEDLALDFINRLPEVLRSGGHACIVHPSELNLESLGEIELQEQYQVRVHKRLTRTISIFKNVGISS